MIITLLDLLKLIAIPFAVGGVWWTSERIAQGVRRWIGRGMWRDS